MADGSIVIDTKIDDKGAKEGIGKLGGNIKTLAGSAGKAFVAAGTIVATGIGALVSKSVKNFAEYEQLIGGVDTLFKESSGKVQGYANDAYKTAGMSANKYMETVTSFSASLLQSLGGDTNKAADAANQAVIDMSDNANKMGTSVESIQLAYQGFAKQNYTMLDNLKLGYGGTKEEMQRLLTDAEKLTGVKYDINNLNDVFNAIHVIQGELGITGTTAKEASSTIEGSFNATKSALENLFTGFANKNADIDKLVRDVIENASNLVKNLLPVVEQTFTSIGNVILEQVPALQPLVDVFKALYDNMDIILGILIPLTAAFVAYKASIAISNAISEVTAALDGMTLAQYALSLAMSLNPFGLIAAAVAALVAAIIYLWNTNEGFRNAIIGIWNAIVSFFTETIPAWIEGMKTWFSGFGDWFGTLWESIKQFFIDGWNAIANFFTQTIPTWIEQMFNWFNELPGKIGYALGYVLATIVKWGIDTWNYLASNVPKWIVGVVKWFSELPGKIWTWLVNAIQKIIAWGSQTYNNMVKGATNAINAVVQWFSQLPSKIWNWLVNTISKVSEFGSNLVSKAVEAGRNFTETLVNAVSSIPGKFVEIGGNIVKGLWNGITGLGGWLYSKVSDFFGGVTDAVMHVFDQHSPSKVFAKIGANNVKGLVNGTLKMESYAKKTIGNVMRNTIPTTFGDVVNGNGNIGNNPISKSGITQNVYITSPKSLSPYEITKQNENMLQRALWGL